MAAFLTVPMAVAAIVLGIAAVAKLHSPRGAVRALATIGVALPAGAVRLLATAELAVAALVLFAPGRATSALLAATYAVLALLAALLARRGATCGCFGEADTPASATHVWLSVVIALVAAAGAATPPRGIVWLLGGSPGVIGPLVLGVAGAAYATVIAYTELPAAWAAWRPQ